MASTESNCKYIDENLYECRKCGGRFSVVEMPRSVSGPGCKFEEEVYCPHCNTFMFSRMIPGEFEVTKHD